MRKDAANNRDAVVDAARRLFVQEGPGVSMRTIAKEAGVGVATATRHFPERGLLREAVLERGLGDIEAAVERHVAGFDKDPEQSWHDAIHAVVGLQLPTLAKAILAEAAADGEADHLFAKFSSSAPGRARGVYGPLLDKAAGAGLCRADLDPMRLHLALAAVSKPLPAAEVLGQEYADQQEFVVDTLLAGLKAQVS